MYLEKDMTLMKEYKQTETDQVHGLEKLILLKMKVNYRFNAISIKIPMSFITELEQ